MERVHEILGDAITDYDYLYSAWYECIGKFMDDTDGDTAPRYLAAKKPQESATPDLRTQQSEIITIKTREGKATVNAVSVMDTLA